MSVQKSHIQHRAAITVVLLTALSLLAVHPALAAGPSYTVDNDPLRQGNNAFADGDLDQATTLYEDAVAHGYKLPEALWGLARITLSRGDAAGAEARCRQAVAAAGDAFPSARAGLGIALLREDQPGPAAAEIDRAIREDPKDWAANYGQALLLIAGEKWDAARSHLDRGKGRHGLNEGEDWYWHGLALVQQGTGDLASAEKSGLKARSLAPANPTYAMLVAEIDVAEGYPALAIPIFEEMLAAPNPPREPELRTRLGRLYESQRRFNAAKDQYLQAVAADSTYAPALKDLANLFTLAKRHDQAAGCYLRLVALEPDAADLQSRLADAMDQAGRPEQALAAARRALALAPQDTVSRFNFARFGLHASDDSTRTAAAELMLALPADLSWRIDDLIDAAVLLNGAGIPAGADSLLNRAAGLDPAAASVPYRQGLLALERGRTDSAIVLLARAAAMDPDNAAYHLNLGIARFRAGNYAEATGDFRRAVTLRNDLEVAHLLLAQSLAMTGDLDAAEAEYRAVLAGDPANAKALRGTAFCSLRRAAYDQAADSYRRAAEADPGNADGWAGLGSARLGQGRLDDAEKAFAKARAIDPANPMLKTGNELLLQARSNGKETTQQ
ncbi:hypothetical protein CO151_11975 [bacterium CG_4_9_14_3_um_filter_65_15]|nr:MAG: hypothetical protein CO151_11975 [bacterium CG_4_9_14_3_um_filter_65_15]